MPNLNQFSFPSKFVFLYKLKNVQIIIIINLQQTDLYVPDDAEVSGDCSNEDDASLILKWKNFIFTWYFTKVKILSILFCFINTRYQVIFKLVRIRHVFMNDLVH